MACIRTHAIVEVPGTDAAFFGSDGGVVRSNGTFTDLIPVYHYRGLTGTDLTLCQQLLSAVPTWLFTTYNDGLSTLQFQSVSVNPSNPNILMGGTQDNGTLEKPPGLTTNGRREFTAMAVSRALTWAIHVPVQQFTGNFHDVNFRVAIH